MPIRFLKNIFWFACFALLMRSCIVEPLRTTDDAMAPQIQSGDVVFVSKLSYGIRVPGAGSIIVEWQPVHKGDVVVAVHVGDPPLSLLRRVTAVPGDTVTIPDEKEPHRLKSGEYILSPDQPGAANESQKIGIISRRAIIGKAVYLWLPSENTSSTAESQVKSEGQQRRMLQPIL